MDNNWSLCLVFREQHGSSHVGDDPARLAEDEYDDNDEQGDGHLPLAVLKNHLATYVAINANQKFGITSRYEYSYLAHNYKQYDQIRQKLILR